MDLTDRQRKLLFAGIVVALAMVGIYLTLPHGHDAKDANANAVAPSTTPSTAPVTSAPPSGASPPTVETRPPGEFDIYHLLPFSHQEFAAGADVARRFTAAYGTYRFDEDPKTYMSRLHGLVTADLEAKLARGSSAPGLLDQRKKDREVSTATAELDSVRDIQKSSVIFLVVGHQHVTKAGESRRTSKKYAVTVTRSGSGWRVSAFLPADVGDT